VPELPDIAAYLAALEPRVLGLRLKRGRFSCARSTRPFEEVEGAKVSGLRRLG
jgi:formamidopyrimidine-DNA glycosylase